MGELIREYTNGEITIVWQPDLCIHCHLLLRRPAASLRPREAPLGEPARRHHRADHRPGRPLPFRRPIVPLEQADAVEAPRLIAKRTTRQPNQGDQEPTLKPVPLRSTASQPVTLRDRLLRHASRWQDVLAVGVFLVVSAVLYRDMFTGGDYMPLPYGDWIAHAYRILFMQEHGLATWDHNWAGGLSLFQGYRIIPTAVTAVFSSLTHASVGRSMLVLEGCLLVSLSPSAYVAARAFRLPHAAALLTGALALGLNNYASPTTSFSALWGLALVAPLIVAIYHYRDSPAIYPIAALCGLAVYVHPHLAECGALALVSAWLLTAPSVRRLGRLGLEAGCAILASAFFWFPALFSARPRIEDQYSASGYFMRLMFHGELHNFSRLGWVVLVTVPLSVLLLWRFVQAPLARYLSVFFAMLLALIALSYYGVGPEAVRTAQNVRLLIVLPLVLGLLAAVSADACLRAASKFKWGRLPATAALVAIAVVIAVPLARFVDARAYGPAWFGADPLNDWLFEHKTEIQGRIWLDDLETPWYTYRQFDEIRSSESHFPVGEWSILKVAMDDGMLSGVGFDATEEYLKAMGVSHIVLPYFKPLEKNLSPQGDLAGRLVEVQRLPSAIIYKTPWTPVTAFLTDAQSLPDLRFPNDITARPSEHAVLDPLVRTYNALAYSNASRPVAVGYPSPTKLEVRLESLPQGQFLVISENWDRSWHARTGDGTGLSVRRYGPNFIGVDVSHLTGEVVITLDHGASSDWKIGMFIALAAIPMSLSLAAAELLYRRRLIAERMT